MAITVGINGFGRIGRQVYKAIRDHYDATIDVVAVNDIGNVKIMSHLLKYDTNYGRFPGEVAPTEDGFIANGDKVKVCAERDPAKLPWGKLGVDIVIESTGLFRSREKAKAHLDAGAKKVIISAPGKDEDLTIVLGVNEKMYDPTRHLISCRTRRAPPTDWRRSPRCSLTGSASRKAFSPPCTPTPIRSGCSILKQPTRAMPAPRR